MTQKTKKTSVKIKEAIRRIIGFPIFIFYFPFLWIFSNESFKDLWIDFIDLTEVKEIQY